MARLPNSCRFCRRQLQRSDRDNGAENPVWPRRSRRPVALADIPSRYLNDIATELADFAQRVAPAPRPA